MDSRQEDIEWLKSTFHPVPKPALPDDCIEYALFVVDSKFGPTDQSDLKLLLKDVQRYSNQLQKDWLKDYIWQRQPFSLELKNDTDNEINYLRGQTEYGDSIEDEWVIVWLLRELTRNFLNLWVKVTDSDGEFLLIEASGTIPAWLEPEVAENRVWINDGQLKIIKPAGSSRSSKRTEEQISLETAHQIILTEPKRIMHSVSIEEEAFYRLRNYPNQIRDNMHHAVLSIPRRLAYLLMQKSAYVAPAIEAFYLRDPIALKPIRSTPAKLLFPPTDLVHVSVKFPRVGYAQLRSQEFPILEAWQEKLAALTDLDHVKAELGMRLSIGFEILLSDKHYQDRNDVREMQLLLDDVESGDSALPSDSELADLEQRADDEKWLDIDFEDLKQELGGGKEKTGKKAAFGDRAAQENLQRIVKQFESFLNNDNANGEVGLFEEGGSDNTDDLDDIDSDDLEEDKEASFGDDDFSKLMQEMMGMPPEVMKELQTGKLDALTNDSVPQAPLVKPSHSKVAATADIDNESDDSGVEELTRQMGAELRAQGALNEGSSSKGVSNEMYHTEITDDLSSDEEEELDPRKEQIAKELLERLQAHGGASGPAANLMDLMAQQYAREDEKKGKRTDKGKNIA